MPQTMASRLHLMSLIWTSRSNSSECRSWAQSATNRTQGRSVTSFFQLNSFQSASNGSLLALEPASTRMHLYQHLNGPKIQDWWLDAWADIQVIQSNLLKLTQSNQPCQSVPLMKSKKCFQMMSLLCFTILPTQVKWGTQEAFKSCHISKRLWFLERNQVMVISMMPLASKRSLRSNRLIQIDSSLACIVHFILQG